MSTPTRARIWWECHTDGSSRHRRTSRADWVRPGKTAELLEAARVERGTASAQGRGLRAIQAAGTPAYQVWEAGRLAQGRRMAVSKARDLLFHVRQARAAGVLRCRLPR